MEPKKVGRALGIGVRVASKMVQQRVAAAANAPPSQKTAALPLRRPVAAPDRVQLAKRGVKAFWRAFLGPFTHAGSILWLEITGLFFALFTAFFVESVYRVRGSWRGGPDQLHLFLYVALAVGFGWFSASSFLRARRKSKRGPASRAR